jgi:uncharacterized protein (DUF1810 family)
MVGDVMDPEADVDDPYALGRFAIAQDAHSTYADAVGQLRVGRKTGHWMWFVFPQAAGLGQSPTSRHYAISSLDEARAYVSHPVLGPRLIECSRILIELRGRSAEEILGSTDAMKLQSSMTLFALAAPEQPVFRDVLKKYFAGMMDGRTRPLLGLPSYRKRSGS